MKYRAEIDGLRALAVVPVILFHANVPGFSGGFVGVDVFFVISGYLITTLIVEDVEAGRFSFLRFYERRARRILPALLLVVLCCIPFARAWMDAWEYRDFMRSAGAVVLFVSNFYFWSEGNYFSPASEERPLLHAWSLSVEEQFYLFAPIVLILMWRLGRRVIGWTVLALAVAGVLAAQYWNGRFPDATFYLPHTRIWELQLGVLCALLRPAMGARSDVAAGLGLVMIAGAVFGFDETTPFPSLYALLPTVGTGLVLLFADDRTVSGRILSMRVLVGIGLVSYSAYLIHQPLFAFARIRVLDGEWMWPALIAATFALACLSWRYVERPFRENRDFLTRPRFIAITGVASASIMAFFAASYLSAETVTANPGLDTYLAERFGRPGSAICGNSAPELGPHYLNCVADTPPHRGRIAVFGDSHAASMLPAFRHLARKHGLDLSADMLLGCPPLVDVAVHRGNFPTGVCRAFFDRVLATLSARSVDTVVLVGRWNLYAGPGTRYRVSGQLEGYEADHATYREALRRQIEATDRLFRERGARVVWVMQVPEQPVPGRTLYRQLYFRDLTDQAANRLLADRSVTRASHMAKQAMSRTLFEQADASLELVDLTDTYCNKAVCPVGDARVGRYVDRDHLSPKGALAAVKALERALGLEVATAGN